MTAMDDKEPFLSRWSRRKLEAKEDAPAGAVKPDGLPAAAPAGLPPAAQRQPAATAAGVSSEYSEYFDPKVDEKLRRMALKKLFGDPHFNVMDGLDTYIDDYSKPDPIPDAMLQQLNQAKALFLFDDEKQQGAEAVTGVSAGDDATATAIPGGETGASAELPAPAPAAAATGERTADEAIPLPSGPGTAA